MLVFDSKELFSFPALLTCNSVCVCSDQSHFDVCYVFARGSRSGIHVIVWVHLFTAVICSDWLSLSASYFAFPLFVVMETVLINPVLNSLIHRGSYIGISFNTSLYSSCAACSCIYCPYCDYIMFLLTWHPAG